MRELRVVGLDVDNKHIICESSCDDGDPNGKPDMFRLRVDDRLRSDDAELLRLELSRFTQDFAQDLIADGTCRLDQTLGSAGGAGFEQLLGK